MDNLAAFFTGSVGIKVIREVGGIGRLFFAWGSNTPVHEICHLSKMEIGKQKD